VYGWGRLETPEEPLWVGVLLGKASVETAYTVEIRETAADGDLHWWEVDGPPSRTLWKRTLDFRATAGEIEAIRGK
jgi:hypothetical protein